LLRIQLFNYSEVFGGQERFLESLIDCLALRGIPYEFYGGPQRLTRNLCSTDSVHSFRYTVRLLNGNRSLYLHGLLRSNADVYVYVQHSHVDDCQKSSLKQWARKVLLYFILKRMDVVIRVCNDALPDFYALGKISTIYNGITLPGQAASSKTAGHFVLLMVGAVNDNKNQILALKLLVDYEDLHLIVVGDGPRTKEWQQWAFDVGVDSRVNWTGFVDAPEQYYRQADALLLLSEFEAFPYVMLEAMAHALPVVATRVGGIPEAITHEKDGLLLPRCDLKALSDAVSRLKNDREWATQLGQQALVTVSERFTVDKMTDNLLALIESAARKKGLIS
jgi:L-malate glycosyltransferase